MKISHISSASRHITSSTQKPLCVLLDYQGNRFHNFEHQHLSIVCKLEFETFLLVVAIALTVPCLPCRNAYSPKSDLIELYSHSPNSSSCCHTCISYRGTFAIPSACTGPRIAWLRTQIAQTLSLISDHPIPLVVKTQQSFGGGGTYFVSSPSDLELLSNTLEKVVLPKLYSQVNAGNAPQMPATLIISKMIMDPVGNWGLTFFVTRSGELIFLAATRQVVNESQLWIGSYITYPAQDGLRLKFNPIMQQIGNWLHRYGYYGPCGTDILEITAQEGNESPDLKIVDLNVRICGSHVLGLMRGHFSERRGLQEGSIFSIMVKMEREEIMARFADEFRKGKIVVVSWYEDVESKLSSGNVVFGVANEEELQRDIKLVKEVCAL